jgi:hypothetical protein
MLSSAACPTAVFASQPENHVAPMAFPVEFQHRPAYDPPYYPL